jgi:hypothetical protein
MFKRKHVDMRLRREEKIVLGRDKIFAVNVQIMYILGA